jgi:hypothetical protein
MPDRPPPIAEVSRPRADTAQPLWLLGGMVLALALARLAAGVQLPLPVCGMRLLTGLPCPFCGGTRALRAAALFQFWDALTLNPMAFLLGWAITFWFLAWLTDRLFHARVLARLEKATQPMRRAGFLAIVLFLNWVYLCFMLPP